MFDREMTPQQASEDPGLGIFHWRWLPGSARLEWPLGLAALLGETSDQPGSWDTWIAHVHPQDAEAVRASLAAGRSDGAKRLRYRMQLAGGRVEWIEDRRVQLPDGSWSGVFIRMGAALDEAAETEA